MVLGVKGLIINCTADVVIGYICFNMRLVIQFVLIFFVSLCPVYIDMQLAAIYIYKVYSLRIILSTSASTRNRHSRLHPYRYIYEYICR